MAGSQPSSPATWRGEERLLICFYILCGNAELVMMIAAAMATVATMTTVTTPTSVTAAMKPAAVEATVMTTAMKTTAVEAAAMTTAPAMKAKAAAPAETAMPVIAAPVPAGTAPGIVVPAPVTAAINIKLNRYRLWQAGGVIDAIIKDRRRGCVGGDRERQQAAGGNKG
jgi:hypothetical protein